VPPTAGSQTARSEYAELVAFGVREDDPGLITLSDVRSCSSQPEESLNLNVSVVGPEVEVETILGRLRLSYRDEQETWKTVFARPDLELIRVIVHDNPAEGLSPPTPERTRIPCVDDRLLPLETHETIVEVRLVGFLP
jgi:hypothetical protein